MPLTLFIAICILGCDVLIYFLFQWTLGEKNWTRRRRRGTTRRVAGGQETELFVAPAPKRISAQRAKALQCVKREQAKRPLFERKSIASRPIDEETAYRRRAAAYASTKQNSKLAL
jgi:hypothetical protein